MKRNFYLAFLCLFVFGLNSSFAQSGGPLDKALEHLSENYQKYNLTPEDIAHYRVSDLYSTRHNGVTHVYLVQQHENIDVAYSIININVLPNGKILNMGNRFVSDLVSKVNSTSPAISPEAAVQSVINHFKIETNQTLQLKERVSDQHYIFDKAGVALEDVSVKLVYQPLENKKVRLAWKVVFYEMDAQNWWNARIDAVTGEVIAHHNQVIHCNFDEHSNCTHSKSNFKNISNSNTKTLSPNALNTYNVFAMPVESPNHGNRSIVTNPATNASPFGWHDTNGADGPEYTITRGNNVHAYQDIFNNNGSVGDEPDGGPDLDFDFPLDLSTGFPYTQVDPAVVNLFYWNNVMHDLWYAYGFDEASGNFQVNNYSNGGLQGDFVRAEALDGSGTNNANFGTGEDGSTARMQMYIWGNDPLPTGSTGSDSLIVFPPAGSAGGFVMEQGTFGGDLPDTGLIGNLVLIDDAIGVTSDACEDVVNGDSLNGNIAVIDRGDCQFGVKILKAENEGAIAAIICNNVAPGTIAMGAGTDGGLVTIPSYMMSLADCNTIKMDLPGVSVRMQKGVAPPLPTPGPSGLDGDFDNGIIAHEYTHGISIRLTGGPSQGGCLGNFEQAGEGWSDWFGMVMQTTPSMQADQPRGIGTYATGEPTNGGGIRPYPYSRNMNLDPHTYADINSVSVPHGVGSVWCVMIWDLYWNLIDAHGFDTDFYNGTGGNNICMQLVLDGLKLQPCSPTFLDSRDAIIAADVANNNGENVCLIWETFARRGLGENAQTDGGENFDVPDSCVKTLRIAKSGPETVEAGGTATYTLEILNNTENLLTNSTITDILPAGATYVDGSSTCPNTSFSSGTMVIEVGDLAVGQSITCSYEVQFAPAPFSFSFYGDYMEDGTDDWATETTVGNSLWALNSQSFEGNFAWFADNVASQSDQRLTFSAPLTLQGSNPVLSFWHRYNTETSWDGGVVEISKNNGVSWIDLAPAMIKNGYNSVLQQNPDNVLSNRAAYNGNSNGYIQTLIDLSNFADDDVLIRFRMGTDAATGGDGWYIDNIEILEEYHEAVNQACVTSQGENSCSEVTSVIYGNLVNSNTNPTNDLEVSIAPNPAEDLIYITVPNISGEEVELTLMTVDGRQLQSRSFLGINGNIEYDLSEFSTGVYLMKIKIGERTATEKVIIY